MKPISVALCAMAGIAFSAPAAALDFMMDFDGPSSFLIPSAAPDGGIFDPSIGSAVLGYYNGDPGSNPPFPRDGNQSWDTTFNSSALAVCSNSAGIDCQGTFPLPPSGASAVIAVEATSFYFEVSPGLRVTKLSFYYGTDGTGSNPSLALYAGGESVFTQPLTGCDQGGFCGWQQFAVAEPELLGRLITKVEFFGATGKVAFDNIAVTTTPIPEPSSYALMLGGLALVAGMARRRRG